jgi:dephospho-CoA kinase
MKKKIVIGLTGPIASGKDTVAKMLSRHGAYVINADDVGHRVIEPQSKAWHGIVKTFGVAVLNRGGKVNRKKLGRLVFGSHKLLKKLDAIVHPEMKRIIKKTIKQSKKKIVVVNAAVLAEMGLLPLVGKVIVVLASEKARLKRLIKAGLSRADAAARIRSQTGASGYRRIADIVITNDKTLEDLREKVEKIIHELKS